MKTSLALETVTFSGSKSRAAGVSEGGLRPVVGVHEHQMVRPTRAATRHQAAAGKHLIDAIFSHHPMLTFWDDAFYLLWLQTDYEQKGHSKVPVYLSSSRDARAWTEPQLLFQTESEPVMHSHHRMGFYCAPNGKLLASTFMGPILPNRAKGGYARLVREVVSPTEFGPVFAIRYNAGFSAANTPWPHFSSSDDAEFLRACEQLLDDKLAHQAWAEEDTGHADAEFYAIPTGGDGSPFSGKAFNWYRLKDSSLVGMWKDGWFGRTTDERWQDVALDQDLDRFGEHRRAKMWAEPLTTGRTAIFYDLPTDLPAPPQYGWDVRTPFVAVASSDGLHFEGEPLVISGDPGPQMFRNVGEVDNKTWGASYARGISWIANRENRARFNDNVWLTYSINKESIWIAEVPSDLSAVAAHHTADEFADCEPEGRVEGWNIRDGVWTTVGLVSDEGTTMLRLADRDPYDYAKAFRVFPSAKQARVRTLVRAAQNSHGELHLELVGARGERPVRLALRPNGQIAWQDGAANWHEVGRYEANRWHEFELICNTTGGVWSMMLDGQLLAKNLPFAEKVEAVERIEFRTGAYRLTDFSTNYYGGGTPGDRATDLPGADDPIEEARFDIASLHTKELTTP